MLSTSHLRLGYDNQIILDCLPIHLSKGESCIITGPSGSGKTTLLYAIAGLLKPIEGDITILNTDITKQTEAKRDRFRGRHIGMIFQTLHLIKSLSVLDNLRLTSYVAGIAPQPERIDAVLKQLNIDHKKQALPQTLSQGQAQRVAIARAILHRPALILADEPTSSLDDDACESVISLIEQVSKASDATLIISTHDSRVKARFNRVITV